MFQFRSISMGHVNSNLVFSTFTTLFQPASEVEELVSMVTAVEQNDKTPQVYDYSVEPLL